MRRRDLIVMPLCEAALLAIVGLTAWWTGRPFLFASLGPTAYELVEAPERITARPYNIIVGHMIGVVSGFTALYLTHASHAPGVPGGPIEVSRIVAAALAALFTVFGTLLCRATQPAAVSTSLVVALGAMQVLRDGPIMVAAIVLITVLGEPIRRWRDRSNALPASSTPQV